MNLVAEPERVSTLQLPFNVRPYLRDTVDGRAAGGSTFSRSIPTAAALAH